MNDTDSVASVATDRARVTKERDFKLLATCGIIGIVLGLVGLKVTASTGWGILILLIAFGAFFAAVMREFKCSYCAKEEFIPIWKENFKCEKCETLHVITWTS